MRFAFLFFIGIFSICSSEQVTWQPPTILGPANQVIPVQVAANDSSVAAAAWVNEDAINHATVSIFDLITGTWGTPHVFSIGISDAQNPDVSVDQDGNIFVVWNQDGVIYAAVYTGSWSTPAIISSAAGTFQSLEVSAYGSGNAAVIWRRSGAPAPSTDIMANTYSGGVWSGEVSLQSNVFVQRSTIDVNDNGYGVAMWYTSFIVFSRIFDNGVWTPPLAMAPTNVSMNTGGANDEARNPAVAVNNNGIAVACWDLDTAGGNRIQSSTLVGGVWSSPIDASADFAGGISTPRIGIDDNGNAITTWSSGIVFANVLPAGGTWPMPATTISGSGVNPDIAVNGSGDAVLVYADLLIFGTTFTFGDSAWSANTPISAGPLDVIPSIAIDEIGNPFVTWNAIGPPNLAGATYGFGIPDAPSNVTGMQVVHRFPSQSDYINIINIGGGHAGAFFRIYRDSTAHMIAQTPFPMYEDHQRKPGVATTYYISQVYPTGQESTPVPITILPK